MNVVPEEQRKEYALLTPAVGALQAQLTVIGTDITELRHSITKLAEAVARIAVIDEKMLNQAAATERAFSAISRLDSKHNEFVEKLEAEAKEKRREEEREHTAFRRAIYIATGIIGTLSCLSSYGSYYALSIINSVIETKQQLDKHITSDKLTDEKSLRDLLREMRDKP